MFAVVQKRIAQGVLSELVNLVIGSRMIFAVRVRLNKTIKSGGML